MENWLTDDFVKAVFGGEAEMKDVKLELAGPAGDNFLSDIYRVFHKEATFIVKLKPAGSIKTFVDNLNAFEKELSMYDFMDEIEEITGHRFAPKRIRFNDMIILEDLKAKGYKVLNRRNQLGFEHSEAAIRCMARFHAASFIVLSDPKRKSQYFTLRNEIYFGSSKDTLSLTIIPIFKQLVKEIKSWSEVSHLADKIDKYILTNFHQCCEELSKYSNCGFLVHGDFHTNNIFFDDSLNVQLIDFQFARENNPVLDIIIFIMTSVRPNVRKIYFDALLNAYIESYNEFLSSFNFTNYISAEKLQEDLNFFKNFTFYTTALRAALVLSDTSEEVKENSFKPNTMYHLFSNHVYRSTLTSLLLEFDESGLLDVET